MTYKRAKYLNDNMDRFSRRDRVFLNNPVIMQGLGLAPLVVVATTGRNALMLCVAVALMLVPTRVLGALLSRVGAHNFRALAYCVSAAVVYIGVYFAMAALFPTERLQLGIYLPMLVMEPLIVKRWARPQNERISVAFKRGVRITVGYVLVVLFMGCLREFLSLGTIFGWDVPGIDWVALPMAALPAGGFILLGTVCAIWRSAVNRYKKYINMEAKRGV